MNDEMGSPGTTSISAGMEKELFRRIYSGALS